MRFAAHIFAGLMLMSVSFELMAQGDMPPLSHFGYLGYDFSMTQSDAGESQSHAAMANWNLASYIKEPYIGQYFGGLTLRYDVGSTDQAGDSDRNSLTGNLTLRMFPMSAFPFELYWLEENQQIEQEEASVVTSRRVLGLVQRYTNKNQLSSLLRIEQNRQEFDDRVEDGAQFGDNFLANLDFSVPWRNWNLSWRNLYRSDENSRTDYTVTRMHSILRHNWRPGMHLAMNGFTSYRDTRRERTQGFSSRDRRGEFNNYVTWRPDTNRPLLVSSVFRHIEFLGGEEEFGGMSGGLTTLSGNANYQLTDRVNLLASASGSLLRGDVEDSIRSTAITDGRYQSYPHRWGTFSYQWNASMGARWEDLEDEYGSVATGIGRFGHSLDKFFPVAGTPITVRLSQFVTALEGSDGQSTRILSQSLSLNWNRSSTRRSSILSASLSDNRSKGGGGRVGNQDRDLQLATLLFSQTENLSRNSRLSGSVSVQVRTTSSDPRFEERTTPSGSADVTYLNQMLFGVPMFQYRSTLRWYSSNFNTSLDDPTESVGTEGLFWDNRLDYRIGRLDLRLLLRLSSVNDIDRNLIYFSVRRNFGGLLN